MHAAIEDSEVVAALRACQRAESWGIERLYDLYSDRLYRYTLARLGDPDTASDLTTELFVRVIEHIGRFRIPTEHVAASLSAWLYRIAGNLIAEHFRKQRRHPSESLTEHDGEGPDDMADPGAGPLQHVEKREELAALSEALSHLSEDQRIVISARFFESMSNRDVAAMIGKSEGAVKALQHRALSSLARFLGRES